MKILFVDDSKAVHAFLDSIFNNENYDVKHVYSGDEAVQVLTEGDRETFDVIFMDWEMPGLTGPESVKIIRDKGVEIPIIMLTTKNEPGDIELALKNGANEYAMKPFTAEILLEKIEYVL